MVWRLPILALALVGAAIWTWAGLPGRHNPERPILRLGSTTSTKDSGLLDQLIPLYEKQCGVEVVVIAKGTGAAIRDGIAGQVDALLVHNQIREEELVAEGYALSRLPIMSNNFLIVGPKQQVRASDLAELLAQFARAERGLFFTRGDQSGTHAAEQHLWAAFGFNPDTFGDWYAKTGTGMGQTLITANQNRGATLVDGATWARHQDKPNLGVLFGENHELLNNPYGYLALNSARIPGVNSALAQQFGTWLDSSPGQSAIAGYLIGDRQAFEPARPSALQGKASSPCPIPPPPS